MKHVRGTCALAWHKNKNKPCVEGSRTRPISVHRLLPPEELSLELLDRELVHALAEPRDTEVQRLKPRLPDVNGLGFGPRRALALKLKLNGATPFSTLGVTFGIGALPARGQRIGAIAVG